MLGSGPIQTRNRTVPQLQPENSSSSQAEPRPLTGVTPMMAQYMTIKEAHPNNLLFYRMGDFYEMFFEDAENAASALDIALTKRGKHLGQDIPMCGVPVHSHENYLNRLIRHGYQVAICEQTEDPAEAKKRGNKSVVRREVVRIITQGTLTEDTLLNARQHNYLVALARSEQKLALAWIDVSTGAFLIQPVADGTIDAALARINPGELLVSETLTGRQGSGNDKAENLGEVLADWRDVITPLPSIKFESTSGTRRLEALFQVKALDAFGDFSRAELAAAGALVDYVELTQKGKMPRLERPKRVLEGAVMEIDAATRRNLELTSTLSGEHKGCLLWLMDRTITGPGARLLASHLAQPLTDAGAISERFDRVRFFCEAEHLRTDLRDLLKRGPDMERALSRLSLGRGGPRDLAAIQGGLVLGGQVRDLLAQDHTLILPEGITALGEALLGHDALIAHLDRALADELPMQARDGGFIAKGYAPELDDLLELRDQSRRLIAGLQAKYAEQTGISGLKVRHNNVLGYFAEITARHMESMPSGADSPFIHRQTMANAVRYSTVELSDLEGRIAQAAERALALELEVFQVLSHEVEVASRGIAIAAQALAGLDVSSSLAQLAIERRYVRPKIDETTCFEVKAGRHPVVEAMLETNNEGPFVANDSHFKGADDVDADDAQIWLLSGPNMAGKSTFLRQCALITVMAQMGSFVPADEARIGIVDRLFSRVGAADDLARGRSTFMVEMVETATILNQAGPRALVILDEIGRGTATYDGLSIAWAVVEHLHEENRCRALFATHYHELTTLASKLERLQCHTMRVKEWKGDVVFLHEVAPGAADRSYGIHVGGLAGLPGKVIARAEQVLANLEKGEQSAAITKLADDLPLFQSLENPKPPSALAKGPSETDLRLDQVNADELTPKQALDLLYELKSLRGEK
jgi:DNA mismatch repair protein MutS